MLDNKGIVNAITGILADPMNARMLLSFCNVIQDSNNMSNEQKLETFATLHNCLSNISKDRLSPNVELGDHIIIIDFGPEAYSFDFGDITKIKSKPVIMPACYNKNRYCDAVCEYTTCMFNKSKSKKPVVAPPFCYNKNYNKNRYCTTYCEHTDCKHHSLKNTLNEKEKVKMDGVTLMGICKLENEKENMRMGDIKVVGMGPDEESTNKTEFDATDSYYDGDIIIDYNIHGLNPVTEKRLPGPITIPIRKANAESIVQYMLQIMIKSMENFFDTSEVNKSLAFDHDHTFYLPRFVGVDRNDGDTKIYITFKQNQERNYVISIESRDNSKSVESRIDVDEHRIDFCHLESDFKGDIVFKLPLCGFLLDMFLDSLTYSKYNNIEHAYRIANLISNSDLTPYKEIRNKYNDGVTIDLETMENDNFKENGSISKMVTYTIMSLDHEKDDILSVLRDYLLNVMTEEANGTTITLETRTSITITSPGFTVLTISCDYLNEKEIDEDISAFVNNKVDLKVSKKLNVVAYLKKPNKND